MRSRVSRPRVRPALVVSALAVCVEGQAGPRLRRASPLPGLPEVPGRAHLSWAEVGPGRPARMEGGGCFPERAFRRPWAPGGGGTCRARARAACGPLSPAGRGRQVASWSCWLRAPFAGGLFCVGDWESGTVARWCPRACASGHPARLWCEGSLTRGSVKRLLWLPSPASGCSCSFSTEGAGRGAPGVQGLSQVEPASFAL